MIWRILKKAGFWKTKLTQKPGLTKAMKAACLQFCLKHKDWILKDWKNVIWMDEISVILLHQQEGYRVWQTKNEVFICSCIRKQWKRASEFMFWGCFSYDKKDFCHLLQASPKRYTRYIKGWIWNKSDMQTINEEASQSFQGKHSLQLFKHWIQVKIYLHL